MRCHIVGEVGITKPWARPDKPFAVKTGETLFDIRGILGAFLLAIIDNIQANGNLLLHHLGDRSSDAPRKRGLVKRMALLSETQ